MRRRPIQSRSVFRMISGTSRSALTVAISIALAFAISACGHGASPKQDSARSGPARAFMMGFSTVPRELNADAYADTFGLAAQHGEIVLIQRTPPWSDFLPGASVGSDTADTTASEKAQIADKKLKLFFAIDPTDGSTGRDRLADLPPSLSGKNFGDPGVRAAFISYAKYVAVNYKPAYLALGVEMNLYYEKDKEDFANFKTLYAQAYDAVKEISPATQVTVTFQYEDLQGLLPTSDKHFPDWQLVRAFDPKLDLVTISTYPSFAFASADAIPADYYSQLTAFTDKPVAIAEMGYASAAGGQHLNDGTEQDQKAFLVRALSDAGTLHMPFVIWFAAWDPSFAKDSAYSVFQHIGLMRSDGGEKPAWQTWVTAARRPYVTAPATTARAR
jgi:hypothetical protein